MKQLRFVLYFIANLQLMYNNAKNRIIYAIIGHAQRESL